MKHQLTALILVFALLLTMTGCSAVNTVQKLDAAEDRMEEKLDAAEDRLEDSFRKAPAGEGVPITEEEARKIALDHVGFTADQVSRLRSEYEIDDGIPQYDVSFYQGDWEYEFEIQAENGKILSYDKDHKYD